MPAARYWRLTSFETYAGGDLELSEAALYEGATRVFGTVTSAVAPDSGSLADLSDEAFGASAGWAGDKVRLPVFNLVFDMGAPVEVTKVGLAGPSRNTFAPACDISYSSDGVSWEVLGAVAFEYAGSTNITVFDIDPHLDAVSLLMHFDGPDEAKTFIDSSLRRKVLTYPSSPVLSAAQSAFGGTSGYNAADTYISVDMADEVAFGTGDFTVECWGWLPALPTGYYFSPIGNWSSSVGWCFFMHIDGGVSWRSNALAVASAAGLVSAGEGFWLAYSRKSGVGYLFVNGNLVASAPDTQNIDTTKGVRVFMNNHGTDAWRGYLDEVRVTRGVGRYTASYSPPAKAFYDAKPSATYPPRTQTARPALFGEDVAGFTQAFSAATPPQLDIYDAGRGRITGTVKEKNTPANTPLMRRVVLLSMPGSRAIRETWSDSVTGVYEFTEVAMDRTYTVVSYDHTGIYRGVVADNLTPEVMP